MKNLHTPESGVYLFILILLPLLMPQPTAAAAFEGRFYGKMWEWYHTNMDSTPEALFWASENAYTDFIGTSWYDIRLARKVLTNSTSEESEDTQNWLHTTLTEFGDTLNLNSIRNSPAFSSSYGGGFDPEECDAIFEHHTNTSSSYDPFQHFAPNPKGLLSSSDKVLFSSGIDFTKNSTQPSLTDANEITGFDSLKKFDGLNRAQYLAHLLGEAKIDVAIDIAVKVPEPSPLLLILGALPALLLRRFFT